ncbi:MAG TPA: glucosidase, partial [Chloroflexota bacterium]|nr:glucosidase [Chloroflexota bacterium]
VEHPAGSGTRMSLREIADDLAQRLASLFSRGEESYRPFRRHNPYRTDPLWRDLVLFYEYFDGDTGEGLGASHQTGWTALIASLLQEIGEARLAPPAVPLSVVATQ